LKTQLDRVLQKGCVSVVQLMIVRMSHSDIVAVVVDKHFGSLPHDVAALQDNLKEAEDQLRLWESVAAIPELGCLHCAA